MINVEVRRAPIADALTVAAVEPPPPLQALAWVGARGARERRTFETIASDDYGQLAVARQAAVLIGAALGALGIAAFICDGSARVRALTPAAESALATGRIRLVNGRLSAPDHFDATAMDAAIAAATSCDPAAGGATVRSIVNRHPWEPAAVQVIDVIALPRQPSPFSFEPQAVVVLRGGEADRTELEPILARAFGLTPAEAEVAARLAIGEPRERIAAERCTSLQTVRSQIKSIFDKLHVTRERELVSMLARITRR
jgi:DNA-binding CsgD family transcriptional regulator